MGALDRASVASEDRLFRSITNVPDAGGTATRGGQQALAVGAESQFGQPFVMFQYLNSMSILKRPNPRCVVQRAGCNEQAIRTEDGPGDAIPMPHKSAYFRSIGPQKMHDIVAGSRQDKPPLGLKTGSGKVALVFKVTGSPPLLSSHSWATPASDAASTSFPSGLN